MQIVFHLGAHCTDEGRLVRSLLRSRGALLNHAVAVPPPRHYRTLLRETLSILGGATATAKMQSLLLDTLVDADAITRLVLFHENLVCIPQRAISEEGLYPMIGRRLAIIGRLFPDHEVSFQLALCNPATLVPMLALQAGPSGYETVMAGANVLRLRWLTTIRDIVQANPGIDLSLWCNEDTPLIWPEVLRGLAGVGPEVALDGDNDLLIALLTPEGWDWLQTALTEIIPTDASARRELVSQALDAHGLGENMQFDINLPGWTDDIVAQVTEAYIRDCAEIAAMPGVRFVQP